jgi:purine-binding chemotaxis protein CheW
MATQFATFNLAGQLFGIDVTSVQEVIRHQPLTSVPLAPAEVRGLINLRGQIVVALDLRRRLGLSPREDDRLAMNVVVRTPEGPISLLVDEIGDVIEVGDEVFERPPETVTGVARALIKGAYKLDGRLLLVLDTAKTLVLEPA